MTLVLLFLKTVLFVLGLLWFHIDFRMVFCIAIKKCHWYLDKDRIESIGGLISEDILKIFLTIHEHEILAFICLFFDFFYQCLLFIVEIVQSLMKFSLCILLVLIYYKWDNFPHFFFRQFVVLMKRRYRFLCQFCVLQLYWIHWLYLSGFLEFLPIFCI